MSARKRKRGNDPAYVVFGPDGSDALDTTTYSGPNRAYTKTIQLCRQVEEALSMALACSTSPLLRELSIDRVTPRRGAAVLRVLVSMGTPPLDHDDTRQALDRARGYLRAEVARSISRKRVPTLQFAVVPSDDGGWNDEGCDGSTT